MNDTVIIEWQFSPPDYFEEPLSISRSDYTMSIANGKVEAKIDSATFDANPSLRQTLHEGLNDRFLGVQLLSHKAYDLSKSTITRVHPDGRRDIYLEAEIGGLALCVGRLDFQVRDKDGNVVVDSKRDRIERTKSIAELVSAHRANNELLDSLLRSYDAAVREPNNELVRLYEIRDALSAKFRGKSAVLAALGISSSAWSRFGQLCNDEPLQRGRHRGEHSGELRDATEAELAEARSIARSMIEAYIRYLQIATAPVTPS